jgi:hypothetical protein
MIGERKRPNRHMDRDVFCTRGEKKCPGRQMDRLAGKGAQTGMKTKVFLDDLDAMDNCHNKFQALRTRSSDTTARLTI